VGTRCANHVTPLYPQKLALISPTGGGRCVGMVRSRTKATEFSLVSGPCNTIVKWSLECKEIKFACGNTKRPAILKEVLYIFSTKHVK